jgi:hypothetical protein
MQGSCLCSEVKFEITGKVPNLYQCHCSLCRKVSGSASSSAFIIEASSFKWVQGVECISKYSKPTGYSSHFCSKCGCSVPNNFMGSYYWVPAGLLDGNPEIKVVAHLHISSKSHWDVPPVHGVQYESAPPLNMLVEALIK